MLYNDPPWHPIQKPSDLKSLGKLGEELGEASAVVSRCIIQGMEGINPDNKKVNREWLEEELADVLCNIELVISHFKLERDIINSRIIRKSKLLITWLEPLVCTCDSKGIGRPRYDWQCPEHGDLPLL